MQLHYLLVNKHNTGLKIEVAKTFVKRFWGWMGKKFTPEKGLLLYSCNSIHTFFMHFAIDAVFIDPKNKVVRVLHGIMPWKIVPPVSSAINVLELPAGQAGQLGIKAGDTLTFLHEQCLN